MNTRLIEFFHQAVVTDTPSQADVLEINRAAMKCGYLVDPSVCNEDVKQFIYNQPVDYNSTFYTTWAELIDKEESGMRLLDQILHYFSTYGTNYEIESYVPNDEHPLIEYKNYTFITPTTPEEMFDRCLEMIQSGAALKTSTMTPIVDYIVEFFSSDPKDAYIDLDSIKNREALVYLCDKLNLYPYQADNLFRLLIYKATRQTMIVNNDETIRAIQRSNVNLKELNLTDTQLIALSSLFLRHKDLFLAFNKNQFGKDNHVITNKLRKLANKYHKPIKQGFWQTILNNVDVTEDEVNKHLETVSIYKVIALMQTISERVSRILDQNNNQLYIIRNQKAYLRKDALDTVDKIHFDHLNCLYEVLNKHLVSVLSKKACVVKYPQGCELTLPSSEKSFVGNYPTGTYYELQERDNIIGIYWRNEWGTRDFDLSLTNSKGHRISWCDNWLKDDVRFSGDMTNADPEATELLYIPLSIENAIINVNRYNGVDGSKYQLFFAQEDLYDKKDIRNYMVDPNNIKFKADLTSDATQQSIALIHDGRVSIQAIGTGNGRVSLNSKYTQDVMNNLIYKANSYIPLKYILSISGYKDYDELSDEEKAKADEDGNILDLTDIKKDSILNLLQ